MCNGLSGFYHRSGRTFFVEPDDVGDVSHGAVLSRMPKKYHKDDDLVAFEFPDWTEKSFHWDHPGEIPDWADKNACVRLLKQVKPIWKKYERVCNRACVEYKKMYARARADYERVCNQSQDEYMKVRDQAWAEHEKVSAPARAEYEKVCDQALAEMIDELSKINGYLAN